jgi:large subunit ribosomal protein L18
MESQLITRNRKRIKRKQRVRKTVRGTSEKPRMSVMKSHRHLSVQLIDDDKGITLASAGTQMKKFRGKVETANKKAAELIGTEIGELAKSKKIGFVVFDRGFYKYHGVLKTLADAARKTGLQF